MTTLARWFRAHHIAFDELHALKDGSLAVKFYSGNARYHARRIRQAMPGAQIERAADGDVALVVVRLAGVATAVEAKVAA